MDRHLAVMDGEGLDSWVGKVGRAGKAGKDRWGGHSLALRIASVEGSRYT